MAYEEDEPVEDRNKLMFFGTNLAEIPCFRNSLMYGIGAGTVVGVTYNLALSRNPAKIAFATYGLVTFGYFIQCRYEYRKHEMEMKKIRFAMKQRTYMEGTEKYEKWAAEAHLKEGEKKENPEVSV